MGYRVSSKTATQFRQWATKTLREHIINGYTVNRARIAKNYDAFVKTVSDIQALLPEHVVLDPKSILELIKEFSSTWVSLNAYDKETLPTYRFSATNSQLLRQTHSSHKRLFPFLSFEFSHP